GAEITFESLLKIRDAINDARKTKEAGVIITTGTDSLEEMAFALDLMLAPGPPVILTAAMKPTRAQGYDGVANLEHAVQVALSGDAYQCGSVLVVISGVIHAGRYVRKQDSALLDAFQSYPGPIGDIRRGKPNFYYSSVSPFERFLHVDPERLRALKVPIWTMTTKAYLNPDSLADFDALVVAGMGTGSLSKAVLDSLSPQWTTRIPIVLTTRCSTGFNYDDHLYVGSLEKYVAKGFRLRGFEGLNALQARIRLMLELSTLNSQ
ncbi:MAG: asparaginase domain-containing protein, partial [Myxococcota bacterium]